MIVSLGHLAATYYQWLEFMAVCVAVLILVSSVDDLVFDAWYWVRRIYRTWTVDIAASTRCPRSSCASTWRSPWRSWFRRGKSLTSLPP